MDEKTRAEFYQEHKDDPAIWDDIEGPEPPSKRKSLSITVRLSPEESDVLRQVAKTKEVSYGVIIREALKMYLESGRPLVELVWSIDYRIGWIPRPPLPDVHFENGFNSGPKIPTGSRSLMSV